MAVFDGVQYSLSPSLSPTRRDELAGILDLNGAAPHPPYTHLIALPASNAHDVAPTVKLVTDRWVDRSIVMGKRQPEQYYSPDPAMIFSGVVACATDLPAPDLEVLSAGISALGGQWRLGLTRDVTHLFALREGSDKYKTALHFAPQTHMAIVTPHWFDDAVRLGRRVPEEPYAWPDPPVLRPGATVELGDDPLNTDARRRRKPPDAEPDAVSEGERVRVWAGRRILLSTSLELADGSRAAIEAGIQRAGGLVVPIADDADEHVEEKAVDGCDVLVTRWRSGKSYFKAVRASLLIGTLSWLFGVESSGTLHSPLDSLLWYPTPRGGIPGLLDSEISITNYTGAARDYLKRLIVLMGARFTPSMSPSNKVLVAGFQPSPKTTRALSWSIPVVNHTWLEDCFVEWRALTVGLERYIMYPPGIDFGKMLMTRPDGPLPSASQSTPTPRLSGGAVLGGRGLGAIDIQHEEARDTQYRTGTNGASTHDPFTKPTTDVVTPFEPRVRASSRAGSVKKTPTSSRAKGASLLTPVPTSAMGAFVDHVIELPDDDEDLRGRPKAATNGKQRARGTPQRTSSPSSVVFSWPPSEADVATDAEERGKGKDSGAKSRGRAPTEDEDARPVSLISRMQPRTTKAASEAQAKSDAKKGAPGRRRGRRNDDMDIDVHSASEASVPPRRVPGTGSATPVKSGMKTRLRSLSRSRSVLGAPSGDEAASVAGKHKDKGKDAVKPARKGDKDAGKAPARAPSPTPSSPLSAPKNTPSLKRRLSVCVPPVPKDYFSSQGARNDTEPEDQGSDRAGTKATGATRSPVESVDVVAAEASTSKSERGRSSAKVSVNVTENAKPLVKGKAKTRGSDSDAEDPVSARQPLDKDKAKSKRGATKAMIRARAEDTDEDEETVSARQPQSKAKSKPGPSKETNKKGRAMDLDDDEEDAISARQPQTKAKAKAKPGTTKEVAKVRAENTDEDDELAVFARQPQAKAKAKPGATKEVARARAVDTDEDDEDAISAKQAQTKARPKSKPGPSRETNKKGRIMDSDLDDEDGTSAQQPLAKGKAKPKPRASKEAPKTHTRETDDEDEDVISVKRPLTKVKPKPGTSTSKIRTIDLDEDDEGAVSAKTKATSKPKAGLSKKPVEVTDEEDDNDMSMIIDEPVTSTSRAGPRRSAANKATARLREEVMPDVVSYEKEQKLAKRRRSGGGEAISVLGEEEEERGGKRRKMALERKEEEEEEEAEVEDAVSVLSTVKAKGKAKGRPRKLPAGESGTNVSSAPARNRLKASADKREAGENKEAGAIRIMTTGVSLTDDVVKRITRLGVQMTTKPTDCTHLIAKGIVRTEKFLCAMAVSPYVLCEEWVNASASAGKLLPEQDYFLADTTAEQKWDFKFADALARARNQGGPNLFKNMTFYVTPKVSIDAKLLKHVVAAGGGQVQTTTPTVRILRGKANRFVVSCEQDRSTWRPLAQEGFKIYSHELVLRGALRQEIEWDREECLVAG